MPKRINKLIKKTLTEIEEFYITNNRDMSIDELVKKLGVTKSIIQKFLDSLPTLPKPKKETVLQQLRTKSNGVVVMTPSVSEQSDAIDYKKTHLKNGCIHKIISE
jgi:DNA-directed RNA polymerase specialized sigma subunit